MGAAIGVFDGAQPVRVRRWRFSPVQTTEDCWRCDPTPTWWPMTPAWSWRPKRDGTPPVGDLDDEYFKLLARLRRASPAGGAVADGPASGCRSRAT
jgi:hypothetical protein